MSLRPPFNNYPVLESQRIRLRQLVQDDARNIFEICYFNNKQASNQEEVAEIIDKIEARYREGAGIHWVIEDKTSREIVGTCGFYRGFENECGEVGYIMKEQFRRGGYMTEAVGLAVNFGFNEMKLKKIFATTSPSNLSSQSVLRKNGFIAAGVEDSGHLKFHLIR
jgi:ribosomal-protein-alanine N-acetyltransferase